MAMPQPLPENKEGELYSVLESWSQIVLQLIFVPCSLILARLLGTSLALTTETISLWPKKDLVERV